MMYGFGITISFELNNKKKIIFDGSGFEEAVTNFFTEWPSITVSPKQLASAPSVEDLIALLKDNVADGETFIFQQSNPIQSDVVIEEFDAYDFITLIRENIQHMSDIANVTIELREYSEMHFFRKYTYETKQARYTGIELGTPEAAEDYVGEYIDQSILSFSDIQECTIIKKEDLYKNSDSDKDFYCFEGCVVKSTSISWPITIAIEGTGYSGRNERIEHVSVGDSLILKSDYQNPYYSPVAIEVFNEKNETLGYLQNSSDMPLSSIAEEIDTLSAKVASVTPLSQRSSKAKYALMDIEVFKAFEPEDDTNSYANVVNAELFDTKPEEIAKVDDSYDDLKQLMSFLMALEDEKLKRLLMIPTKNCLTTQDEEFVSKIKNITFDEMCQKGYIRFNIEDNIDNELQDCFIYVDKQNKNILGDDTISLSFMVFCKNNICDLDGYKVRKVEICSILSKLIDGIELPGIGTLYFTRCSYDSASDEYCLGQLYFVGLDEIYTEIDDGTSLMSAYSTDNQIIFQKLMQDVVLKKVMGVDHLSEEELYNNGYCKLHDDFIENLEKGYKAWIMIKWDYSNEVSVMVCPVCRVDSRIMEDGTDRLELMSELIKEQLQDLYVTAGGYLEFNEDYSSEEIKISDDLVAAMLVF